MTKLKKLAALLAVAMLTTALASCGGSGSTTSSSSETAKESSTTASASTESGDAAPAADGDTLPACKMTVWLAGSGEKLYNDVYGGIIDSWIEERAPGSTKELSFISWADYFSKLSTGLAGGAAPDVYMTGYGQMGSMNAQGYELNLSEYFPADWDGYTDIPANILGAGMVDGNLYGLLETATRCLMYRKDIAEQNGVTEDDLKLETLDDLTNLVEKMCVYDDNGNLVMAGWDVQTGTSSPEQYTQFIATNFADDFEFWSDDSKASFNNDACKSAVSYLKSLLTPVTASPLTRPIRLMVLSPACPPCPSARKTPISRQIWHSPARSVSWI